VLLLTSGRVCFTHWFPQVIACVVDSVGFIGRWFHCCDRSVLSMYEVIAFVVIGSAISSQVIAFVGVGGWCSINVRATHLV